MTLATHVFRLGILIQSVFRDFRAHLQKMSLHSAVSAVATYARHLISGQRIQNAGHGMALIGMPNPVVTGKGDRRQVARGDTFRILKMALET